MIYKMLPVNSGILENMNCRNQPSLASILYSQEWWVNMSQKSKCNSQKWFHLPKEQLWGWSVLHWESKFLPTTQSYWNYFQTVTQSTKLGEFCLAQFMFAPGPFQQIAHFPVLYKLSLQTVSSSWNQIKDLPALLHLIHQPSNLITKVIEVWSFFR